MDYNKFQDNLFFTNLIIEIIDIKKNIISQIFHFKISPTSYKFLSFSYVWSKVFVKSSIFYTDSYVDY